MDIAEQISKLTLQDSNVLPQEPDPAEELTEVMLKLMLDDRKAADSGPGALDGVPAAKVPDAFSNITPQATLVFEQVANGQYKDLNRIDELVNSRCQEVLSRLESLTSPNRAVEQSVLKFLDEENSWLKKTLAKVKIFVTANRSVLVLKSALIDRLDDIIDAVNCYKIIISKRSPDGVHEEPISYDAG